MKNIKNIISHIDKIFLDKTKSININKNGIIFLLFNSIFLNEKEIQYNHVDSQYGFTIDEYRYIFEEFLNAGYTFISHKEFINKDNLDSQKKYIYLHFDDGYFNNFYILPLLKEYNIHSHFFIVIDNILNNEKFWWDTIYYESKQNDNINYTKEIDYLINFEIKKIKKYIKNKFGQNSLIPKSNIDRPFIPSELKEFSSSKYVTIGNHTLDHTNLNILSHEDVTEKIFSADQKIEQLTGSSKKIFSFPNSNRKTIHTEILKNLKYKYAISEKFKNYKLSQINSNNILELGRYCFVRNKNIQWQIQICKSKFSIYLALSKLLF